MKKIGILLVLSSLLLSSCHIGRFFLYNAADMRDYKKFPQKELTKSDTPFMFTNKADNENLSKDIFLEDQMLNEKYTNWDELFKRTKTLSFIVIKDDKILYERYFSKNRDAIFPAFSVTKSYISALVGIAIDEGKIKSVDEPITNYLDFFEDSAFSKITIEHLLNMQSGIHFKENYYNPFSTIAKYYYGLNLTKYVKKLKIKEELGKRFEYISVNPLLLGMIIEKATGEKLYNYINEKIWKPLNMEFDASINTDSEKDDMTKSFCGINARAIDYAKFGRLYLNKGNWNGKQIIPEEWVKKSITYNPDSTQNMYYQYQWRVGKSGDYYAHGLLGQYIYVYPKRNIIIQRSAKKDGNINWFSIMRYIARKI